MVIYLITETFMVYFSAFFILIDFLFILFSKFMRWVFALMRMNTMMIFMFLTATHFIFYYKSNNFQILNELMN
jgi:hypothetical protein